MLFATVLSLSDFKMALLAQHFGSRAMHIKHRSKQGGWVGHGRATEEGRRTGFPLLRYGCQLRARALEHSSIWRNLKCLLYIY
jgi:hypothetical protein